jgi:tRNA-dihydrouridine synthase
LKPDLAYEIVRRTKAAVNIPVSVKVRLAWDRSDMTQKDVNE